MTFDGFELAIADEAMHVVKVKTTGEIYLN